MLPESNEPSARALSKSVGAIWIMWIKRMPSLLERMTVSAELANIAEVNANDLPDPALHAAATCLGMLVAACMYEHGFDQNPDKLPFEPLPALLGPWRIVSRRIGSVASLFTKTRLLLNYLSVYTQTGAFSPPRSTGRLHVRSRLLLGNANLKKTKKKLLIFGHNMLSEG